MSSFLFLHLLLHGQDCAGIAVGMRLSGQSYIYDDLPLFLLAFVLDDIKLQ